MSRFEIIAWLSVFGIAWITGGLYVGETLYVLVGALHAVAILAFCLFGVLSMLRDPFGHLGDDLLLVVEHYAHRKHDKPLI